MTRSSMRITAPDPCNRVRLEDIDLADNALYAQGDPHLAWQTLRAESPLFWQNRSAGEGFWAVTRLKDVRRVLSEHETFTSEAGTAIAMLDSPDPAGGSMMQSTDPPRHHEYRRQLAGRFSSHAAASQAGWVRSFVRKTVEPALDGGVWDAAAAFTRLPMAVGARMMDLPDKDIDPLIHLAFSSLAPGDPHFSQGSEQETALAAHCEIMIYFEERLAEVRKNPADDLISHLLTLSVDGRPLTDDELLVNCLSLLLGAVVTTAQTISAMLVQLAGSRDGEGRWPRDVPLDSLVDEALRWSSPVNHFMRRARVDVEMHGRTIRAGEAVTAWIASANRDEEAFARPYEFDPTRSPNPHIVFGTGSHRCIGSNFARVMLREAFAELMETTESFTLAGDYVHLLSNEIAGFVSLPVRFRAARRPTP
ncbi:cytochrome P450 [Streptomyces sp. NPDC001250]|uniref:cytochrome P450 n=1 Tax=Streptomyces sp. NPDC001250 TaxID=3154382 RepID=UPI00332ACF6E